MKQIAILSFLFATIFSYADEGMLVPNQLKTYYKDMKKAGLRMSYKKIYNENKPSVKDAIVSLGGFCTAEIISPKGLMLTNHHCGYDAIAENSTVENDYLTDGFWSYKMEDEIPIAGLTASIVVRIDDVTDAIMSQLTDNLDADERKLRIKQISDDLIKKAT